MSATRVLGSAGAARRPSPPARRAEGLRRPLAEGHRGCLSGPPVLTLLGTLALAPPQDAPRLEPGWREWLVAGPVPAVQDSERVIRDYLGGQELKVAPTHGAVAGGLDWRVQAADADGHLNFNRAFGRNVDQAVAYAAQYLFVPEDVTLLLRVRSDDDLAVFLNGQRIWVNEIARSVVTAEDSLVVQLAGGWNLLLLKVINRHGGFGTWARMDGFPGGPAPGLVGSAIRPYGYEPRHPTPVAVVEAVELGPRLRLGWQGLYGLITVRARSWGAEPPERVWIRLASATQPGNARAAADTTARSVPRIGPVERDFQVRPGEAAELRAWVPFPLLSTAVRDARLLQGSAHFGHDLPQAQRRHGSPTGQAGLTGFPDATGTSQSHEDPPGKARSAAAACNGERLALGSPAPRSAPTHAAGSAPSNVERPPLAAAGPKRVQGPVAVASTSRARIGGTHLDRNLQPGTLLERLSAPIELAHVRYLPASAPPQALRDLEDVHWLRAPPPDTIGLSAIGSRFPIPVELDGLSLELHASPLQAADTILLNGRPVPAAAGRATLCAPCRLGDTIAFAVPLPAPGRSQAAASQARRNALPIPHTAVEAGASRIASPRQAFSRAPQSPEPEAASPGAPPAPARDAARREQSAAPAATTLEPPLLRVREPGYKEVSASLAWWREGGGPEIEISAADRNILLAAVESPGKTTYLRILRRYRTLYSADAERIRRDTLHLVGNSHIDAAWLWRWGETVGVVRDTWSSVLEIARRFPGFVYAQSSAQYYEWMEERAPELFQRLGAAVDSGVWVPVGGWWVEADQNLPSGEALVRQGLYGQRYFKSRFGRYARVAWTPDSFGYAWTLPQILRGQGFEFFVTQKLRWNDSTAFPFDVFRWEAPDGTWILTYIPYRYNDDLEPRRLVRELKEFKAKTGGLGHQLVLYGVGDHGGGPTLEMLERWQELRRVETFPAMRHTSPEAALERIRGASAEFPSWRDELYLEYHRGTYTTHGDVKKRNRGLEAKLEGAEKLAVVSGIPYPRAELEGAWKRVLFNQFHDILPGTSIPEVYADAHASYDEADQLLDGVIARATGALSIPGAPGSFTVFNPLSAARGGRVEIPGAAVAQVAARPVHVVDEDGARYPVEEDERGGLFFSAPEVPGLGFRTFRLAPGRVPAPRELRAGATWIENDVLRVTFSPATGEITSLYDKRARREVLERGGRGNRIQVFGDRPAVWDAWNIGYTGEEWTVREVALFRTEADPAAARAFLGRRFGASRFDQVLVLRPGSPVLEIEHVVDWREEHKLAKLAFPVAVRADSAAFEIPYGVIRRSTRPRTPAERAKWEVSGQR